MAITTDILDAVKVKFLKSIFEDDFTERGMIAWLTGVEYSKHDCSYILYFDFSEFEEYNKKYFRETYYPNIHTGNEKPFYTAIEAGMYTPKLSVYFSVPSEKDNPYEFAREIQNYLVEVVD